MARDAESEGLSVNIHLLSNKKESRDSRNSSPPASYWEEGKKPLGGLSAQILSFDDLNYSVNDAGQGKILFSRQEGPPKDEKIHVPIQLKWLHLQGATMNLDTLGKLIMDCPLIGDDVKAVTMTLIGRVRKEFLRDSETGPYIEPGSVLRGIGIYPQPKSVSLSHTSQPTVPVVFISSPYLKLSPLDDQQTPTDRSEQHSRALLQHFHGFDVTPNRDKTQIVRKMGNDLHLNDAFHANQMWCLLIGSTILITMSEHTADSLLDGIVAERISAHDPPIKIEIIEHDNHRSHDIAISSNTTWVDLFKITMDAVQKKRSEFHCYDLRDDAKAIITAERWVEIAKSQNHLKSHTHTFYLCRKQHNFGWFRDRPLLEYKESNVVETLDGLLTKNGQFTASGRSSRKDSNIHSSTKQRFSTVTFSLILFDQDGNVAIVSSPDPQDSVEVCHSDKDSSQSEGIEYPRNMCETTSPDIDNSSKAGNISQDPAVEKGIDSNDDIASNTTDNGGTIDLTDINKYSAHGMRMRREKQLPSSKISIETYPSAKDDDPNASNDMFLKQLFHNKQRRNYGSISSVTSNHTRADVGSACSDHTISSTFSPRQHPGFRYHAPSPIITRIDSKYIQRQDFAENDKMETRKRGVKTKNENSGAKPLSKHEKRNTFARYAPATAGTNDTADKKHDDTKLQASGSSKIIPFFLWGPCIPASSSTLQSAKEADMIKLLNDADKDIANSQLGVYYYVKVPELTEEEFFSRQDVSSGYSADDDSIRVKEGYSSPSGTDSAKTEDTAKGHDQANDALRIGNSSEKSPRENVDIAEGAKRNSDDPNSKDPTHDISTKPEQLLGILAPDKQLIEQLVEISQQILWSFMPKTGSSTVHILLKRFWGCIDTIRRQLVWEENEPESHDESTYIIRDFSFISRKAGGSQSPNSQKTLLSKCEACRGGIHYNSAEEALAHFHSEHFNCHHKCKGPYDDPCYSWLHRIWHSHYPIRNERNELFDDVQQFVKELSEILAHIRELHAMVTSGEDDFMGDLAVRPPLPKKIFYVFQKIVQVFVLRSKTLSFMTRRKGSLEIDESEITNKINELQQFEKAERDRIFDLLDHAKRDIFLSDNTSSDLERSQSQAVGAECLALAIICKSHNLMLDPRVQRPDHNGNFLQLYKDYISKLHFQANRRPQKRVFQDIRDLEEELDALDALLGRQKDCVHKFAKSISPDTLRLTTMTRVAQSHVENSYKEEHMRQLDIRMQEVQNMKTRSRFLKEQVKQNIEILEEDHGKAIRVFTIVTLFFLPLSFVSSFLGMNTADVRNMQQKQGLFWATGIPVTICVLTLACIYGYKGDEIRDWVIQQPRFPSKEVARLGLKWDDGDGYRGRNKRTELDSQTKDGSEKENDGRWQVSRKGTLDSLAPFQQGSRNEDV
ncbi:hypothetical protein V8C35DRAFT_322811 [Trichoderma chlorosporum]